MRCGGGSGQMALSYSPLPPWRILRGPAAPVMKGKTMLLTELTTPPSAQLPIAALKDHLRFGTAFGTDGLQDGLIEAHLRAAIAAIEARIGKVLLTRSYRMTLPDWRELSQQTLPLAPVTAVTKLSVFDVNGVEMVLDAARYRVQADMHRPKLLAAGLLFPVVPTDGRIEILFTAGFGPTWAAVPADLAQAVILLAAQFYETRHDAGAQAQGFGLPMAVQSLIERYRNIRVLGGGRAKGGVK